MGRTVEKLGMQQQAAIGPDIAHEHRLAPAGMAEHDIGGEPFVPQRPQRRGDGVAASGGAGERFGEAHRRARARRVEAVGAQRDWRRPPMAFRHDGDQFVAALALQGGGDVEELAGEILVQKQDAHGRVGSGKKEPFPGHQPPARDGCPRVVVGVRRRCPKSFQPAPQAVSVWIHNYPGFIQH